MKKGDANDPKGLIYESYQIDGITKSECRTIFLDCVGCKYRAEHPPDVAEIRRGCTGAPDDRSHGGRSERHGCPATPWRLEKPDA